jgi:hypothetical protein
MNKLQCSNCREVIAVETDVPPKFCPECGSRLGTGAECQPAVVADDYDLVDDGYEAIEESPGQVVSIKPAAEVARMPARPKPPSVDYEVIEDGVAEDSAAAPQEPAPGDSPRKKNRKKKKSPVSKRPADQNWLPPTIALGVLLMALAILGVIGLFSGPVIAVITVLIALTLVFSMPVSIVILVASMFISSSIMGGIDYGDARVAIPKALILLIIVNLVYCIPCAGPFMAAPVWLLGAMVLFKLDLWEARLLIGVNWILNAICQWLLISTLVASVSGAAKHAPDPSLPDPGRQYRPPSNPWRMQPLRRSEAPVFPLRSLTVAAL